MWSSKLAGYVSTNLSSADKNFANSVTEPGEKGSVAGRSWQNDDTTTWHRIMSTLDHRRLFQLRDGQLP